MRRYGTCAPPVPLLSTGVPTSEWATRTSGDVSVIHGFGASVSLRPTTSRRVFPDHLITGVSGGRVGAEKFGSGSSTPCARAVADVLAVAADVGWWWW